MKQWVRRLLIGHYNILLFFLFSLFLFRPYHYEEAYRSIWKTFLTFTLVVSIFNCHHSHRIKIFISIFAFPVLASTWYNLFFPTPENYVFTSLLTALFMFVCACSIIQDVILLPRVNFETLRGLICAYFLVAFFFAYIYFFIEYLNPGTMQMGIHGDILKTPPHFFSDMLYFSFITLLTLGYGDIFPVKEWGETTAVIEAIFGQFYMAILVARIISVYAFMSGKRFIKTMAKPHSKNHKK